MTDFCDQLVVNSFDMPGNRNCGSFGEDLEWPGLGLYRPVLEANDEIICENVGVK